MMYENGIRMWLVREPSSRSEDLYVLFGGIDAPVLTTERGWSSKGRQTTCVSAFNSDEFHQIFPDIALDPGEGPIEVSVDIREIEVGEACY